MFGYAQKIQQCTIKKNLLCWQHGHLGPRIRTPRRFQGSRDFDWASKPQNNILGHFWRCFQKNWHFVLLTGPAGPQLHFCGTCGKFKFRFWVILENPVAAATCGLRFGYLVCTCLQNAMCKIWLIDFVFAIWVLMTVRGGFHCQLLGSGA